MDADLVICPCSLRVAESGPDSGWTQCGDQSKSEMKCVMLLGCASRAMQKRVPERTGKCFPYNGCTKKYRF